MFCKTLVLKGSVHLASCSTFGNGTYIAFFNWLFVHLVLSKF